jgi:predicted nucleic acid-binding protein
MPEPPKRYWDSSVFLEWIMDGHGHADMIDSILDDARADRCRIFTSTVTLAEVTRGRHGPLAVDRTNEDKIANFFRNDYIRLVPLDVVIGTRARQLIWDHPHLKPRDAIHIATALQIPVDFIEAYDNDFLKVGARNVPGFPVVREPAWTGQQALPLPSSSPSTESLE